MEASNCDSPDNLFFLGPPSPSKTKLCASQVRRWQGCLFAREHFTPARPLAGNFLAIAYLGLQEACTYRNYCSVERVYHCQMPRILFCQSLEDSRLSVGVSEILTPDRRPNVCPMTAACIIDNASLPPLARCCSHYFFLARGPETQRSTLQMLISPYSTFQKSSFLGKLRLPSL